MFRVTTKIDSNPYGIIILGILLLVVGVVVGSTLHGIAGSGIALIGLVALVVGIVLKLPNRRSW